MHNMHWIIVWSAVLAGVWVQGADMTDKDGRVYRNYRIKEISNGEAMVLYSLPDGMPEAAYVRVDRLPDEVQIKYGIKARPVRISWWNERTLREKIIGASRQLERDLQQVPADDHAKRHQAALKLLGQVENVLAGYGETAEFEFISNDRNGALVRVVGTGKGSQLRSRQYIYLYRSRVQSRAFKMRVYPSGDVMHYGKYGRIAIYGASTDLAAEAAAEFMGRNIGDNMVFKKTELPVPPGVSEAVSTGVVNNYYIEDDGKGRYVYWDKRHRPGDKRPGKHPGRNPDKGADKRPKPRKCPSVTPPGREPGRGAQKRPGSTTCPERGPDREAGKKPNRSGELPKNQPIVVKKEHGTTNYGLLPEWARPGNPGKSRR